MLVVSGGGQADADARPLDDPVGPHDVVGEVPRKLRMGFPNIGRGEVERALSEPKFPS
jgi:hypothetical protein